MNGEVNSASKKHNSATIVADDRRFGHVINTDGVFGTHRTPIPYIAHLLAVAATVLEYEGSEDMAIAALLHDAVEDQGGEPRLSDIRNRFGDRVADIVRSCSDTVVSSSAGQKRKTGTPARTATSNTSIWSTMTLFSCPSPTKYTTLAQFCVTFVSLKPAMPFGNDLRLQGRHAFVLLGACEVIPEAPEGSVGQDAAG